VKVSARLTPGRIEEWEYGRASPDQASPLPKTS
jgi:hypothetical protein